MKIFVTGTRGIPNIQGGIETHIQELCPLLALKKNVQQITVICRSNHAKNRDLKEYKNIRLKYIYAPNSKLLEALVHTFLSVLYASLKRPDVLHIHAVGPNLFTPLARLLGLKVVMTHHGPDYERQKWGKFAKLILRLGEFLGVKFANKIIVINESIEKEIIKKFNRCDSIIISNGVSRPKLNYDTNYLSSFDLLPGKYLFTLGRFVPEKGYDYLIRAFAQSKLSEEYKLVIAGDSHHVTPYSIKLKELAKINKIVFTGFITEDKLSQIFCNSALFILPSYYEGLPIALLEAMSYNLPILASNISANLKMNLPESCYFEVGNERALLDIFNKIKLKEKTKVEYDMTNYNWDNIANSTLSVYEQLL